MYSMNPKEKFHLFRSTKHFCSAPWNLVFVGVNGEVTTCVNGRDCLGNLQHNTMEEIIDNVSRQEIKKSILNDAVCNNCQQCLKLENSGINGNSYNHNTSISQIYESEVDKDGFLYAIYSLENVFGK
ncbi:MAG: hypothetical protein EBU01_14960 [Crocinitomicaceae bacterium]|nr:hypothetical protein [Crocinitomicaceae bacterium]